MDDLIIGISRYLYEVPQFAGCTLEQPDGLQEVAIDVGSTGQRAMFFDLRTDMQSEVLQLSTEYAIIDEGVQDLISTPASAHIADCMEVNIRAVNPKSETMIRHAHVVKGSLMRRMNLTPLVLTSDTSKVDSEGAYINIITDLALICMLKSLATNTAFDKPFKISLTCSLPPDDATSSTRVNQFRQRLEGIYTVDFPILGRKITISIADRDILTCSEPVGAALAYIMQDDFDQNMTHAFLDCGGRSSGVVIYRQSGVPEVTGDLLESTSVNFPVGGSNMLAYLSEEIVKKHGIQRPNPHSLNSCFATGKYQYGNTKLDVVECIEAAKARLTKAMFHGFTSALATNGIQATELANVYCSGQTFGITESDTSISDSVCTQLQEMFKARSPKTVFLANVDPTLIVSGLVFHRWREGNRLEGQSDVV